VTSYTLEVQWLVPTP